MRNKLWTEREDEIVFREMSRAVSLGLSMHKPSMSLAQRLGRSSCAVQNRFQNLRIQKRQPPIHRTVRHEVFLMSPAVWLRIAKKDGPIAIIDRFGKVRAVLSVPGAR